MVTPNEINKVYFLAIKNISQKTDIDEIKSNIPSCIHTRRVLRNENPTTTIQVKLTDFTTYQDLIKNGYKSRWQLHPTYEWKFQSTNKPTQCLSNSNSSQILNLRSADPFGDVSGNLDTDIKDKNNVDLGSNLIHIRIQQRNGRKTLTTVQGITDKFDLKKLVRSFKKEFACNGTVIEHLEYGEVIQLQGDQRNNVCEFLTRIGIAKESQLKVLFQIKT